MKPRFKEREHTFARTRTPGRAGIKAAVEVERAAAPQQRAAIEELIARADAFVEPVEQRYCVELPLTGDEHTEYDAGAGGKLMQNRPFYAPGDVPLQTRYLPNDSQVRKEFPIATGCLDYFPDALAAVAEVSYVGNEKHNPGEPTHWSRGKSMDHADALQRHFMERGSFDPNGLRHSAQMAWRALALLQEELEAYYNLAPPRGTFAKLPQR
jgi:hypothetical protein